MALFPRGDRGDRADRAGRGDRTTADTRPREYRLSGEPVVTGDSRVVLVDAVVRFDPVPPRDDRLTLGWDADGERVIHAVVVTTLRVAAESVDRDVVVEERARLADPLSRALELAPVATGFTARVATLEVSDRAPAGRGEYEVRVVT
ncbi:MAG TPA: hypothetical protein VFJ28_04280 [Marmoricola sp.]|nr:hypothetical protein [Marmoricola sp.]